MAQNEKPLFPRESGNDSEVQRELIKDVKEKLEVAESASEFELPDFRKERLMPPLGMDQPSPTPPTPAYGPPPLPVGRNRRLVFILVGFLLALFVIYKIIKILFVR